MSASKRKKHPFILFLLFLLIIPSIKGQNKSTFQVIWWNVENLFDCEHDSLKNDSDFLPESTRHWTNYRLASKLHQIAQTFVAIGKWNTPALIGLCEVENDNILNYLTQKSTLRTLHYKYIMTHSQDLRGIDVALLYQRDQFKLLNHEVIHSPQGDGNPTRDILHASGLILSLDTLDLFLCHLPSRIGGKASLTRRNRIANLLRHKVDSVISIRERPHLIIMGDFNDPIASETLTQIMQIKDPQTHHPLKNELYHLFYHKAKQYGYGSYKYKGVWQMLDHILVSGLLITPQNTLYIRTDEVDVARLPFLLKEDVQFGGKKPFRTYNGMRYEGGVSDHLPLYANFQLIW